MSKPNLLVIAAFLVLSSPLYGLTIKEPTGKLETLPETYVDKGACPFECCTYGAWVALEETPLLDKPDGKQTVANLKRCEKVEGVTGDFYVKPSLVEVVKDYEDDAGNQFKKGDKFYLLSPQGEGFFSAWADGKLFDVDGVFIFPKEDCDANPSDCWAMIQGDPGEGVWWMQVKTSTGVVGWTKEPVFDGQDSCGVPADDCGTDSNGEPAPDAEGGEQPPAQ
ncbi:MAG: hypothetical protein H6970_00565 [Gammaproteobacteria bacterium]|nr:hypothetical protein [Gammaproteobacteria bacterium]MCP5423552.1 hypothetical protein [Gammaproteobacteria bacterium]